jgi:hypothetical protein
MALRLKTQETPPTVLADWPIPGRSHFMRAEAFKVLASAMDLYVLGQLPGRSFLIAGHRGAGKTSLVQRAVAEQRDDALRTLLDYTENNQRDLLTARGLRRPLLVKLHGPSLVASDLPRPGGGEPARSADGSGKAATAPAQPAPAPGGAAAAQPPGTARPTTAMNAQTPSPQPPGATTGAGAATQVGGAMTGANAATQAAGATTGAGAATPQAAGAATETAAPAAGATPGTVDPAHVALVQIAIALYRALADECATSFAQQTRGGAPASAETAAQLRLDLDQTASAATLRSYWNAVGCLQRGVLWPRRIGEAAVDAGLRDQGLREILALVTAGQAFQVCSGAITYKQTEKDSRSSETSREAKAAFDFSGLANRLASLGVGALLGWGVGPAAGLPAAAGAGVGAALVGALGINWSSKQSASRQRDLDYTFLVDRSVQTLDRDLPLVIERVRDAGLAPIFLIDELDKLDHPAETIGTLIRRLKHLITDYGFFCFLTDRDYYESVQRGIETGPYPREHTYFSDRLFILYTPLELARYVRAVVQSDVPVDPADATRALDPARQPDLNADRLARAILAKAVVYRSKLNTVDAVRELARGWNSDGTRAAESGAMASQFEFRLVVAVQLAIEYVLRHPDLAAPIQQNASFAQIAVDALYFLSREWEEGKPEFSGESAPLWRYLAGRLRLSPIPPDDDDLEALLMPVLASNEQSQLSRFVNLLADMLTDFSRLRVVVEMADHLDADDVALLEVIPRPPTTGLLQQQQGELYRYLFDTYGRDIETMRVIRESATLPQDVMDEINNYDDYVANFDRLAQTIGFGIADLVTCGALPPTVRWEEIVAARNRAVAAGMNNRPYPELAADMPVLRAFVAAIVQRGRGLARVVKLVVTLHGQSGVGRLARETLQRLTPLLDFGAAGTGGDGGLVAGAWLAVTNLPGAAALSIQRWLDELRQAQRAATIWPVTATLAPAAWDRWLARAEQVLLQAQTVANDLTYDDLLLAALQQPPATLFRRNLGEMLVSEWSTLVLLGAMTAAGADGAGAPAWAIIVGLRALQFDAAVLQDLVVALRPPLPAADGAVSGLAPSAAQAQVPQGTGGGPAAPLAHGTETASHTASAGEPPAGSATADTTAPAGSPGGAARGTAPSAPALLTAAQMDAVGRIASNAATASPGELVLADDAARLDSRVIPGRRPSLLVARSQMAAYDAALRWLIEQNVFEGYSNERQAEADP